MHSKADCRGMMEMDASFIEVAVRILKDEKYLGENVSLGLRP